MNPYVYQLSWFLLQFLIFLSRDTNGGILVQYQSQCFIIYYLQKIYLVPRSRMQF